MINVICIKKGTAPSSLTTYSKTSNADFDNLDTDIKEELRISLLKEQGYICAYCMKRIPENYKMKIEHYVARNPENNLVYTNLLAVCNGNEGSQKKRQTCDTQKGNQVLNLNPQNQNHIETITYTSTGFLKSNNLIFQNDIDNILNLNDKEGYLISNRKAVLDGLKQTLKKYSGTISKGELVKIYNSYNSKSTDGKYKEYVGILLWYLKKKI